MPLRLGTPRPSLAGATEWLGTVPDPEELTGRPVLVHFWAVSCHICHENMPTVAKWRDTFGPAGLTVVAVHMPREEDDLDVARIRHAVTALDIREACAIDNEHAIARSFQNEWVPAYFLFDREGALRSRAAGTTGLGVLESALRRHFEPAAAVTTGDELPWGQRP